MASDYSIMKEIKRLRTIRGSGTELISVYIPAGFQINEEMANSARSTASHPTSSQNPRELMSWAR